jgi:hypothetical protein
MYGFSALPGERGDFGGGRSEAGFGSPRWVRDARVAVRAFSSNPAVSRRTHSAVEYSGAILAVHDVLVAGHSQCSRRVRYAT